MSSQLGISACSAILLLICQLTAAQVPFPRNCPEVKVPSEFTADAYMGTWYEYAKYPHIFEIAKRCMFARYTNKGNNTIGVINTSINTLTGHTTNTTGVARMLAPSQINVLFSKYPNPVDTPNYIVLGTDYKSYSVVYSCNNLTSFAHTKLLWILTRERKPSAETVSAAKKIMDDNNLPQSFLLIADQDNCPEVASSYGTTINFGDNSVSNNNNNNNNNNANKINKQDNEDTAEGAIILKKIIATATSTANPPTTSEFDLVDTTAETAANVVELA
ncbi:apolipoprotein D [Ceratitis capitata]|uniref:apolipoprotein D n=1 Tax=Ceratitis capitata TaxID=7213 RepID=UPI000329C6AC|nr:apolipoprotein D [Ceratitis capitata]